MAQSSSASVAASMPDPGLESLIARRKTVREWLEGESRIKPLRLIGLALSGGGIRSATFSLGLIQALAKSKRDALNKIDIMSTVSGGGYMGCFLRSLFVPENARGIAPKIEATIFDEGDIELDPEQVADQFAFASKVLRSGTDVRDIPWGDGKSKSQSRRNPLWWLREHSRFLAPNGATDYTFAIAYIGRNWIAMLYIFLLASLAILSSVVFVEALARDMGLVTGWTWPSLGSTPDSTLPCGRCQPGIELILPISPVSVLLAIPLALSVVLSIAYWMTQAMSANEPRLGKQWTNLFMACGGTVASSAVIIALAERIRPEAFQPRQMVQGLLPTGTVMVWILTLGIMLTVIGAVVAVSLALTLIDKREALTRELRRHLTISLATCLVAFFAILATATVDSAGAGLAYWLSSKPNLTFGAVGATAMPLLAYFIKKLPEWFGGSGKSTAASLLSRFFNLIAFLAGFVMFGVLAIAAATVVHLVAWTGMAWVSEPDWPRLYLFVGIVGVLAILAGTASGFINLSSLHLLYTSRLTRAYLGASNNQRLEAAASFEAGGGITDSHKQDFIQPVLYSRADLPAPIHIINATINETIDPQSELVARDRKGDVLSLEPSGIRVGKHLVGWKDVGDSDCAEQLSLGQWCAISGAAASSGMGRLTNLGLALAFTFANVRLGYWWWSPGICTGEKRPISKKTRVVSRVFGTFIYLFNEMTARYSRDYQRKYLTDGGHFENTGAYRLIERRVPVILLADNGADPLYRFEDLENLVRKVRLDLGGEIDVLGGMERDDFLADHGVKDYSIFVDPGRPADWRKEFLDPESQVFAMVLRVTFPDEDKLHLIWIKPRVLPQMPADLIGYAASNPLFPQQPTSDQFFDEEQWESYRKLGELCMHRLLESCPALLAD